MFRNVRKRSDARLRRRPRDLRDQMLRETSAFLTWALNQDRDLPRIPRRRVSDGGFARLLRQPGARAAIDRWWVRTLEILSDYW